MTNTTTTTDSLTRGHADARKRDRILVVCCALFAVIGIGAAIGTLLEANSARILETRGVRVTATVLSGSGSKVRVAFDASDGAHTTEIRREGKTLCPDRLIGSGCASINAGLEFPLVYDPQHPSHAMSAEVVDSSYWFRVAIGSLVVAIAMWPLSRRPRRWLRKLSSLRRSPGVTRDMRITDITMGQGRYVRFGYRLPPTGKATLVDVRSGQQVAITSFPTETMSRIHNGDVVRVAGTIAKHDVIAIERADAWVFARVR